jgi:hypothetical protein
MIHIFSEGNCLQKFTSSQLSGVNLGGNAAVMGGVARPLSLLAAGSWLSCRPML